MFLFSILNIFFTIVIIVLLIRYFIERYQYYGFGPVMVAIVQITEKVLQPIKKLLPRSSYTLQEQTPLFAIAVTLVLRGLFIWLLIQNSRSFASFNYLSHPYPMGQNLLYAMSASFTMGVLLIGELLIAFLFAAIMITRRGITMAGNAGFMCFQERTFAIFRFAQKYVKTQNLTTLFFVSSTGILLATALLAALTSLSFVFGAQAFLVSAVIGIFSILKTLIHYYMFILILSIVASWVGADHYSSIVQVVRAMSDPYLNFFRKWFPWARIDFLDLSPIFAFIFLSFLIYLLGIIPASLLTSIQPGFSGMISV